MSKADEMFDDEGMWLEEENKIEMVRKNDDDKVIKKAIERLNKRYDFFKENPLATNVWLTLDIHNLGILLNLIETQQKEIENLKENYIRLQNTEAIQDIYIKKNKIKVILEEYKYTEIGDSDKIIEFYKKIQSLLKEE